MADYVAGTVTYKLDIDSRAFDRGLDTSRDKVKSLGKDADKSSKQANDSLGNVAKDSLQELTKGFKNVTTGEKEAGDASGSMHRQMSGNIGRVVSSLDGFDKQTRRNNSSLSSFRGEIREAASAVRSLQVAFSGFTGAALIGAVSVAGGVLVELAGAAVTASGALLTVPAGAAVAAGAIATAKLALIGLDDAFKAIADGDIEKLNESLLKLSPAAQKFVLAAKDFKDAFDPVRRAVQEALFTDLDKEMTRLSTGAAPGLEKGLTDVATSMNHLIRAAAATVSEPFFQGFIDRSTAGTARAITTLSGAVSPLAQVLDRVVQAGLPFIQQFAEFTTKSIQSAAAFLQTETGMAALQARMQTGLSVIGQLLRLVGALGSSLNLLFKASEGSGQTLIQTLTGIVEKFNAWASTAEGQQKLTTMFAFFNQVLDKTITVVAQVAMGILEVINFISGLPKPVQDVITSFVAMGIVLTPVIMFVAKFATSLMALGPVLGLVGKWLAVLGTQALVQGARIALGWIIAMGPVAWVIAAVIALVAIIALNFDTIKKVVSDTWNAVVKFAVDAWNGITSTVSRAWNGIVSAVSSGVSSVINFVRDLPGRILGALGNLGRLLWDAGRQMLEGLGNGIQSAVEGVQNKLKEFAKSALNTIKSFFGIRSPSRVMAEVGGYMMEGLAQGISRNAIQAIRASKSASQAALAGFNGQATINPSLRVGAATALQARAGAVLEGTTSTATPSPAAAQSVNIKVDMKGIMTRSQADKRAVAKDLIESVNQELRSRRLPEIGNGAIAA